MTAASAVEARLFAGEGKQEDTGDADRYGDSKAFRTTAGVSCSAGIKLVYEHLLIAQTREQGARRESFEVMCCHRGRGLVHIADQRADVQTFYLDYFTGLYTLQVTHLTHLVPVDGVFDGVEIVRWIVESLSTEDVDTVVRLHGSGAVAEALVGEVEQLAGIRPAVSIRVVPLEYNSKVSAACEVRPRTSTLHPSFFFNSLDGSQATTHNRQPL